MAAQDRVAREKTSWAEAVEKLRSKQAALKEQAAVASPSEPAESVGLQQHLQDPQRHLRPPTIPTSPQNAWERALASLRKAKAAAQDPDGAIQEIEVHFRKLFPHDTLWRNMAGSKMPRLLTLVLLGMLIAALTIDLVAAGPRP
jgi:hypothetical protein